MVWPTIFSLGCAQTLTVVGLYEDAILSIAGCLKDSERGVRSAALKKLSMLAAHGTRYHLSSFDVPNRDYS